MISIVLTEPDAALRAFALYCAIGVIGGGLLASVYWLWSRRPDMPQGFFRHPPSRATAAVIALANLLAFIVIGARAELLAFHRIEIADTHVRLHFAFPERSVALPRSDIQRTSLGIGGEKGSTVRLVVYTRDGQRYESTPAPRARTDQARAALGRGDLQ